MNGLSTMATEEATGLVSSIQRYCIHDGPGIRTIVFLKGCPLRCLWCSNPENQEAYPEIAFVRERCLGCGTCTASCPSGAMSVRGPGPQIDRQLCRGCGSCADACPSGALRLIGKRMTPKEVMAEVRKDEVFFRTSGGGVTVSGGEPLAQPHFVAGLFRRCKEMGLHTAVETSGYAGWNAIEQLLQWVDLFLYDLKVMNPEKHKAYTGVDNRIILENLSRLSVARKGRGVVVRIPLVPTVNLSREELETLARFVAVHDIGTVHLLPYHAYGSGKYAQLGRSYRMSAVGEPSEDEVAWAKTFFERHGIGVAVGGT